MIFDATKLEDSTRRIAKARPSRAMKINDVKISSFTSLVWPLALRVATYFVAALLIPNLGKYARKVAGIRARTYRPYAAGPSNLATIIDEIASVAIEMTFPVSNTSVPLAVLMTISESLDSTDATMPCFFFSSLLGAIQYGSNTSSTEFFRIPMLISHLFCLPSLFSFVSTSKILSPFFCACFFFEKKQIKFRAAFNSARVNVLTKQKVVRDEFLELSSK